MKVASKVVFCGLVVFGLLSLYGCGKKADIDAMNKSVNALKDHFEVYYNKLKEKGGDLSRLDI